jgi:hypothetical protein
MFGASHAKQAKVAGFASFLETTDGLPPASKRVKVAHTL